VISAIHLGISVGLFVCINRELRKRLGLRPDYRDWVLTYDLYHARRSIAVQPHVAKKAAQA
jgi:hypothetical protein